MIVTLSSGNLGDLRLLDLWSGQISEQSNYRESIVFYINIYIYEHINNTDTIYFIDIDSLQ